MARVDDLRADYDRLGELLGGFEISGSEAAAIVRERRILGAELERLEALEGEVPLVDQLAAKREAARSGGSSARRKSG